MVTRTGGSNQAPRPRSIRGQHGRHRCPPSRDRRHRQAPSRGGRRRRLRRALRHALPEARSGRGDPDRPTSTTTSSSRCSTRWRPGILSEGEIAPPIRNVLRRQRNVEVGLAEVTGFDLEARTVTAMRSDRGADHDPLRQPDRRRRRRPVLLRSRRVLALGAGNEDDRRCARDPRSDPRRVRDGRARRGSREAARMAHVRRRRRRPHGGRDRRSDRGAVAAGPAGGLPHDRLTERSRSAVRRRQGDTRRLRRPPLGEGGEGARSAKGSRYRPAASSPTSTAMGWR